MERPIHMRFYWTIKKYRFLFKQISPQKIYGNIENRHPILASLQVVVLTLMIQNMTDQENLMAEILLFLKRWPKHLLNFMFGWATIGTQEK